jgi:predicted AAA+ superfamily ATPase
MLLKEYCGYMTSSEGIDTKIRVVLVSGASDIGKTTFVTVFRLPYNFYLNKKLIDVIIIDFEETTLQEFEKNKKGIMLVDRNGSNGRTFAPKRGEKQRMHNENYTPMFNSI